jgi:hypothetical protein
MISFRSFALAAAAPLLVVIIAAFYLVQNNGMGDIAGQVFLLLASLALVLALIIEGVLLALKKSLSWWMHILVGTASVLVVYGVLALYVRTTIL